MFSYITINWRGRPLETLRTVIELISATTTTTGLTIQAAHDPTTYEKGVKISNSELAAVPLHPHDWHGEWNYTIVRATRPGVSPNSLQLVRAQRDIRQAVAAGDDPPSHIFDSSIWKQAKDQLLAETSGKCAYCEASTDSVAFGDVRNQPRRGRPGEASFGFDPFG